MKEEYVSFIRDMVDKGIFVRPTIRVWKPIKSVKISDVQGLPQVNNNDTVSFKRRFKVPRLRKSIRLVSSCNQAIRNLSYQTVFGNFVAEPNIVRFKDEMEEFRGKLEEESQKILADYDEIIEEVRAAAAEMAQAVWVSYGHEGSPHSRFINSFVDDYMSEFCSREDVVARYKFRLDPVCPIIPLDSSYNLMFDLEEKNMNVYRIVYEKLLVRRRSLVKMLLEMEGHAHDMRGSERDLWRLWRRLLGRLKRYLWSLFYDVDLLNLVEALRATLLVDDEHRTPDAVCEGMRDIRRYIVDHPFFRTGLEVKE